MTTDRIRALAHITPGRVAALLAGLAAAIHAHPEQ